MEDTRHEPELEGGRELTFPDPKADQLIPSLLTDCVDITGKIVDSDDSSVEQFYSLVNKGLDSCRASRKESHELAEETISAYKQRLEDPATTEQERREIMAYMQEIYKQESNNEHENAEREKEYIEIADRKDDSKRTFSLRIFETVLGAVGFLAVVAAKLLLSNGNNNRTSRIV